MKYILFFVSFIALFLVGCVKTTQEELTPTPTPTTGDEAQIPKPMPTPTPPLAQSINALGTEPFWNFTVSGNILTWNQPNDDGTIGSTPYTVTSVMSGTTILINGTNIQATITSQICSDGMSDNSYTHTVNVIIGTGSTTYNGCATVTP